MCDGSSSCSCGCAGQKRYTPARIYNAAGLSALSYRVGTHARFKADMLARIPSQHALSKLTTRSDADLSVAILDSWATVADVLSFYQERIANEGFLRTATERMSLLELARSIGYELRPGVAAGTYLAFTMDTAAGSPEKAVVASGTKVQSIPGQDEKPQVFETTEEIEARQSWNGLKPVASKEQDIYSALASGHVVFAGTATKLRAGDGLLFQVSGSPVAFRVAEEVQADATSNTTAARFSPLEIADELKVGPSSSGQGSEQTPETDIIDAGTGFTAADLEEEILSADHWTEPALQAKAELEGWSMDVIEEAVNSRRQDEEEEPAGEVYAFRTRCGVFGNSAPPYMSLPALLRKGETIDGRVTQEKVYPVNWDGANSGAGVDVHTDTNISSTDTAFKKYADASIYLDNVYANIPAGSLLVIRGAASLSYLYRVAGTIEKSLIGFSLTARATGLQLERELFAGETASDSDADDNDSDPYGAPGLDEFYFRTAVVYAAPEKLELARVEVKDPVEGSEIVLGSMVAGLEEGRPVVVSGELDDQPGIEKKEVSFISSVVHFEGGALTTRIELEPALEYRYRRDTVTINANVASATHGETKEEAIGGGDPSKRFQKFALKNSPLTFVSAQTPTGVSSTLVIRVDGVEWKEVKSFEGLSHSDRIFVTRRDNDGVTYVIFGDGVTGALPPAGQENIRAKYRAGLGSAGMLAADQLTLLMKRPLGMRAVSNPLEPTGGDDPESLDDARKNAPRTVLTLDRIVSLQDYRSFAQGFAGIGKAASYAAKVRGTDTVVVAVASSDGEEVDASSELYANLVAAIEQYRDAAAPPFVVRSFNGKLFNVRARIKVSDDRESEDVADAATEALKETFSFDSRDFGQAVTESEVIAALQAVAGVEAVDLKALYEHVDGSDAEKLSEMIRARSEDDDTGVPVPALLLVNKNGITIDEMVVMAEGGKEGTA